MFYDGYIGKPNWTFEGGVIKWYTFFRGKRGKWPRRCL